jgi:hypothetical protein
LVGSAGAAGTAVGATGACVGVAAPPHAARIMDSTAIRLMMSHLLCVVRILFPLQF